MVKQAQLNEFSWGKSFSEIKLKMFWDGKTNSQGKCQMEYELFEGDKLLIEGDDFCLSPLHAPDSIDAIVSLLGFLTLRKGDTDDEYFKGYSPEMLQFATSTQCGYLRDLVNDFDGDDDEFKKSAIKFFTKHSKINV